jgi:lia operon protein LiaG
MVDRGKNVLPMIGFILIIIVIFGGFVLFGQKKNTEKFTGKDNSSIKSGFGYDIDSTGNVSTDGVDKITIRSVSSEVKISTHNSDQVNAHFYGNVVGFNKENVPYLIVEKNGDEALVRIVYPLRTGVNIREETKLNVLIPEDWNHNIEIKSISGDITADQLTGGDITLNTTSGNIKISEIKAKDNISVSSISGNCSIDKSISDYAKINTSSGDIIIDSLEAEDIKFRTISGDAKLNITADEAELDSTSGNIVAEFTDGFEKISAKSISGNVKLGIPGKAEFTADLKTLSGSINCKDFSMNISSSGERVLKGRVGRGDGKINISTTSGDIKIYGLN